MSQKSLKTALAKPWSLAIEILQENKLSKTEQKLWVLEDKTPSIEWAGSCTFESLVQFDLAGDQEPLESFDGRITCTLAGSFTLYQTLIE